MMHKKSKLFALVLSVMLIIQSSGVFSYAATDLKGHWSEVKMTDWINKGYIKGYPDGTVKPNNKITRAEFMAIVNKAFGYAGGSTINYSDVKSSDWYHSVVATAVSKGYIGGYPDGKMRPNAPITRAEAAVIITKVAKLPLDPTTASYYNDKSSIPTWALGAVGAVTKSGIMSGYTGGIFGANRPITRAETVMALAKAVDLLGAGVQVFATPGTYGPETGTQLITGDARVMVNGVTLKNMVISGNLIVDKAVGSGNATFSNVTVQGNILVEGGGVNSVYLDRVTANALYASRKDGTVRIVATASTRIDNTYVNGDTKLEEIALSAGGFLAVTVDTTAESGLNLDLINTKLDALTLKGKKTEVGLDSKSTVTKLTVSGADNVVNTVNGTVIGTLVANSAVTVSGAGQIVRAEINASGVVLDVMPDTLVVKSGVTDPIINGSSVATWTPANGATNVAINTNIVIKFSDEIRLQNKNTALTNSNVEDVLTLRLKNASGSKVSFDATVTTSSGKTVITINPTKDLLIDQVYYVAVDGELLETEDNEPLPDTLSSTFTTIEEGIPLISSFDPENDETGVDIESEIAIRFSEKVRLVSGNKDLTNSNVDDVIVLKKNSSTGSNVPFEASVSTVSSKTVIIITPDSDLLPNQKYYVAVKEGVIEDYSNNELAGEHSAVFTTAATNAAPVVEAFNPANGATNASITANLTITFNKLMRSTDNDPLTNSTVDSKVVLRETSSSGAVVAFDASVATSDEKTVITVNPSASLKSGQLYYLAVSGVEDELNQALTGVKSITFTTAGTLEPRVETFSPSNNAALNSNVVLTFNKEVRAEDNSSLTNSNVKSKANLTLNKNNGSGAAVPFVATVAVVSGKTVITMNPTDDFEGGSTYYVSVDGLEDLSNRSLTGETSFTFTTAPQGVTSVTVTGAGGATTITTDGGTLQMAAEISPANASNKSVTWSVTNVTGEATINSNGRLTAVSNGTVKVRATSVSTPSKYGELTVTITNQVVEASGLSVYVQAFNPPVFEKQYLRVKTAATANHTIYYRLVNSNPSAPFVGQIVNLSGWTTPPNTAFFDVSVPDGKYLEAVEVNNDNEVTRWGKAGPTDDGLKEITSIKSIPTWVTVQGDGKDIEFVKADLTNTVILKAGSTEVEVPVVWGASDYDNDTAGNYTIIGTIGTLPEGYVDLVDPIETVTVNLKVETPELTGISVLTPPDKLTYTSGEAFSLEGIRIRGVYNNGQSANVTDEATYSVDEGTIITESQTIVVTVDGETTTFDIVVN